MHTPSFMKYVHGWKTDEARIPSGASPPIWLPGSQSTSSKAPMRILLCTLYKPYSVGFWVLYQLSDTTAYLVILDKMTENRQQAQISGLKQPSSTLLRHLKSERGSARMAYPFSTWCRPPLRPFQDGPYTGVPGWLSPYRIQDGPFTWPTSWC